MSYGFHCDLAGNDFAAAVVRVTEALKAESFDVLAEIDVQTTMKAELGIDGRAYRILGPCNSQFAHRSLETEPHVGLLLPCNVAVREEPDGRLDVALMDYVAIPHMTSNPEVARVVREVRGRLERVSAALAQGAGSAGP